jgi:hypothetical protein
MRLGSDMPDNPFGTMSKENMSGSRAWTTAIRPTRHQKTTDPVRPQLGNDCDLRPVDLSIDIRVEMDHMTHREVDRDARPKIFDAHASHDRHAGQSFSVFRDKFWLSSAFTIPVVFWSTDVQHWLGHRAPSFLPWFELITPILGTRGGRSNSVRATEEVSVDGSS